MSNFPPELPTTFQQKVIASLPIASVLDWHEVEDVGESDDESGQQHDGTNKESRGRSSSKTPLGLQTQYKL